MQCMGIARKQIGNFTFKERTLVRKNRKCLFPLIVNQDAFDKHEISSVVCVNSSEQARKNKKRRGQLLLVWVQKQSVKLQANR